jgi:hypothetical protein
MKIVIYFCLITKVAKRKHVNVCYAALYGSICTLQAVDE